MILHTLLLISFFSTCRSAPLHPVNLLVRVKWNQRFQDDLNCGKVDELKNAVCSKLSELLNATTCNLLKFHFDQTSTIFVEVVANISQASTPLERIGSLTGASQPIQLLGFARTGGSAESFTNLNRMWTSFILHFTMPNKPGEPIRSSGIVDMSHVAVQEINEKMKRIFGKYGRKIEISHTSAVDNPTGRSLTSTVNMVITFYGNLAAFPENWQHNFPPFIGRRREAVLTFEYTLLPDTNQPADYDVIQLIMSHPKSRKISEPCEMLHELLGRPIHQQRGQCLKINKVDHELNTYQLLQVNISRPGRSRAFFQSLVVHEKRAQINYQYTINRLPNEPSFEYYYEDCEMRRLKLTGKTVLMLDMNPKFYGHSTSEDRNICLKIKGALMQLYTPEDCVNYDSETIKLTAHMDKASYFTPNQIMTLFQSQGVIEVLNVFWQRKLKRDVL